MDVGTGDSGGVVTVRGEDMRRRLPSGTRAARRHRLGEVAVARRRSGVPSRSSTVTVPVHALAWRVRGQWRRGQRRQQLW